MMNYFLILLSIVIFIPYGQAQPDAIDPTGSHLGWKEVLRKNDVKVFAKSQEGDDILTFKIMAQIKAPIEMVLSNLRDVDSHLKWLPDLAKKFTVENYSDLAATTYSESIIPWPFHNRDFVLKNELKLDKKNGYLVMTMKSVTHEKIPEIKGIVRGDIKLGIICARPLKNGHTDMIFFLHVDPKGSIPTWLVNFVQKGWSYEFVKSVEKRALTHHQPLLPEIDKMLQELKNVTGILDSHNGHKMTQE